MKNLDDEIKAERSRKAMRKIRARLDSDEGQRQRLAVGNEILDVAKSKPSPYGFAMRLDGFGRVDIYAPGKGRRERPIMSVIKEEYIGAPKVRVLASRYPYDRYFGESERAANPFPHGTIEWLHHGFEKLIIEHGMPTDERKPVVSVRVQRIFVASVCVFLFILSAMLIVP